jgi:hypothetical protein
VEDDGQPGLVHQRRASQAAVHVGFFRLADLDPDADDRSPPERPGSHGVLAPNTLDRGPQPAAGPLEHLLLDAEREYVNARWKLTKVRRENASGHLLEAPHFATNEDDDIPRLLGTQFAQRTGWLLVGSEGNRESINAAAQGPRQP